MASSIEAQSITSTSDLSQTQAPNMLDPAGEESATGAIVMYFKEHSVEFRELDELRKKGWNNPNGDVFFKKQRLEADKANNRTAKFFYDLMKKIGEELHQSTNAFRICQTSAKPMILDMCMAPGGFLATAMSKNPFAEALAFSLPVWNGGHKVLIPDYLSRDIRKRFLDVTMLAGDIGCVDIPKGHPDTSCFLPRQLMTDELFDIALCDGQVLRTHERAPYREKREHTRLTVTQLALGLEHLRPGGNMVVLLHKMERFDTANILRMFSKFSSVMIYKPRSGHKIRSSFYLVATNVQSQHPDAVQAVKTWKAAWKVATFGTDEEYRESQRDARGEVEMLLAEFGEDLVKMGKQGWRVQADALSRSSFIQN